MVHNATSATAEAFLKTYVREQTGTEKCITHVHHGPEKKWQFICVNDTIYLNHQLSIFWPIFTKLLQLIRVFPTVNFRELLEKDFPGRMPFLSPKQQDKNKNLFVSCAED